MFICGLFFFLPLAVYLRYLNRERYRTDRYLNVLAIAVRSDFDPLGFYLYTVFTIMYSKSYTEITRGRIHSFWRPPASIS